MAARGGHRQALATLLRLGARADAASAAGLRAQDLVPKSEPGLVALLRAGQARIEEDEEEEALDGGGAGDEAAGSVGEVKEALAERARALSEELHALDVAWATSRGAEAQGLVRRKLREAGAALDAVAEAARALSRLHANRYS